MRTDYTYVTVVYRVDDHTGEWQQKWDDIHRLFKIDEGPLRVTAVSLDNEIARKDAMVAAAERVKDHYDLREVIGELDGAINVADAIKAFEAEYPEK